MSLHAGLLVAYSAVLLALGLAVSRRVRSASGFFVADRRLGGVLLAAIFSAEVSTSDPVLFMLATSLSQDLYRRFVNPAASDA
ncbi:MAG TPA: hypothetical protein PLN93_02500 [Vicinamibacterales bacterium]|mgnify:CR=1 FL=1|nr:hypothetical protein [Vicinamibacterales bacterium]HOG27701.1 hypothetical protein [Vicinamibacterales bacterium]HOQ62096.1 hypothetical protein [Vicinamibacterales bacterium]HPK70787.1 hypothetical protein [Vicinamibacterales bacterium]HPW19272.1 hypothetical protein [Vicinamibacterales bacterium]